MNGIQWLMHEIKQVCCIVISEYFDCIDDKSVFTVDVGLQYQLELKAVALRDLCLVWQTKVRPIPPAYPMPESWGPSELELREAAAAATHGSWIEYDSENRVALRLEKMEDDRELEEEDCPSDDDGFSDGDSAVDDDDLELVDEIEDMLWGDAHVHSDDHWDIEIDCGDSVQGFTSELSEHRGSTKRLRIL